MSWSNTNSEQSIEAAREAFLMVGAHTGIEIDLETIETSLGRALRAAKKVNKRVPDPSLTDLISSIEDSIECEKQAERSLLG